MGRRDMPSMVQRAMETTLVKGLKILELVAHSRGPRGVSELARELSITRSNAHRLLQTLSALGYTQARREARSIRSDVEAIRDWLGGRFATGNPHRGAADHARAGSRG